MSTAASRARRSTTVAAAANARPTNSAASATQRATTTDAPSTARWLLAAAAPANAGHSASPAATARDAGAAARFWWDRTLRTGATAHEPAAVRLVPAARRNWERRVRAAPTDVVARRIATDPPSVTRATDGAEPRRGERQRRWANQPVGEPCNNLVAD